MQSSQNSAVSIDPIQWANWLQSIAKNPQGHGKIVRENNQYTYLSAVEIKQRRSVEVVNIQTIMNISRSLLQNQKATAAQTYQMVQGLRYIHQQRESKYQNMFFLFRWFAKLGGVEARLAKEKAVILSLEESVKSSLNTLGTLEQRENINEAIFEGAKNLHALREVLSSEDTERQAEIEALKKKIHAMNPRVPTIKSLIKAFGPEVIKPTFQETIEFIYAEKTAPEQKVSNEELARDQALFQCSELEAKAIYIKRLIKHQRTDLSLSLISGIERNWEQIIQEGNQKSVEMNIDGHHVLFIPGKDGEKGEVFIHDIYLAKGTYKAAFIATEFFTAKKKDDLNQYAVLLPADAVEENIPEDADDTLRDADRWTRTQERKKPEKKVSFADSMNSSETEDYSTASSETDSEPSGTMIIVSKEEIEADNLRRAKLEESGTLSGGTSSSEVKELPKGLQEPKKSDQADTEEEESYDSYSTFKINKPPAAQEGKKETSTAEKSATEKSEGSESKTKVEGSKTEEPKVIGEQDTDSLDFSNTPEISSTLAKVKINNNNTILKPAKTATKQSTGLATEISEEEQEYRREAGYCVQLGKLKGIWPTHKVATVDGHTAIIQKKAGYRVEGLRRDAIDLENMAHLLIQNRLPVKDQIAFLRMVGDFLLGVQSVHEQGLIHRDIKPKNILCDKEKAGLSDFGLVCPLTIQNEKGESIPNPERYTIIGTAFYMAPEVIGSDAGLNGTPFAEVDQKVDIWSVGISLWQMLAGKLPHEHPAVRCPQPMRALFMLQGLLTSPTGRVNYENKYPEPADKKGIEHLIWSCTRIDSKARPDIQTVVQRYNAWMKDAEAKLNNGEMTSIFDAFSFYQKADIA